MEVNPLTYPAPLPTTVAGIFGALLGWDRKEAEEVASKFYFGSKLTYLRGTAYELARVVQYKQGKPKLPPPLLKCELLIEPDFLIAIAGDDNLIKKCEKKLENACTYLPYGGRNEYFVKNFEVLKCQTVTLRTKVENYVPLDWIKQIELYNANGWIKILKVRHKIKGASIWFGFVYDGALHVERKVKCVEGMALYPLNYFFLEMRVPKGKD